jgi:NADPH2:quinone reductase
MTHAIRVHKYGGHEVLKWERIEVGDPGPGEVKIRQTAIGLNFIDIYHRTGFYPQPSLPFIPGSEAAGVIAAVGPGVRDLNVGRHVAYAGVTGAYAEERLIAADRVVKIPKGISDETAAAIMLKGMTAQYLLRRTYKVGRDTTLLFHAAAGGVGLIACQWAASLGATVIGTVGSAGKALIARPWLRLRHQHARGGFHRQGEGLHQRARRRRGVRFDRQGHVSGIARLP